MFSLCIATVNRFDFLKNYLPKYISNTYISEIIICDENGNDCEKISKHFQSPKLKLYVNEKTLGPFLNKLKCCNLASCDWVALLDSDNFADMDYFEVAHNFIINNNCSNRTILAPSFAKPQFDYRLLSGMIYKKNNFVENREKEKSIKGNTGLSETLMNTGNYILHRNLTQQLDIESHMDIINKSSACDVILMNTLFFKQLNAEMYILENMEYEHVVHNGSTYLNNFRHTQNIISIVHKLYKELV